MIDEENYKTLENRIEEYRSEIKEEITREDARRDPGHTQAT